MITQTINGLFEKCPDVEMRVRLDRIAQSWRKETKDASALFFSIRDVMEQAPASPWRKMWFEFEDEIRRHSTVLTPYELSRVFGLDQEFEAATYYVRVRMADRLRLDCDFPESERRSPLIQSQQMLMQQIQQQQMQQMMQGQDPWVQAQAAELRAGKPRKMLDRETLERLRAVVRSYGIDLKTEKAMTIQAVNVEEAIQFARLLSHDRNCDLFRGQPMLWNPIPNILRLPISQQSSERWQRFKDWALQQEPLAEIARHGKKLAAVAQHYGLPTYLLDFSKNPRVAAFFATHTDIPPENGQACIYCLWSGGLDAAYHHAPAYMRYYGIAPETERVEVNGLFRMHAQEGSFVYANQETWTATYNMDVIRFPRTSAISSPVLDDIYPSTKSEIELLVDEYFANEPEWLKQCGS